MRTQHVHSNTLRTVGLARLAPYTYTPPATPGEIILSWLGLVAVLAVVDAIFLHEGQVVVLADLGNSASLRARTRQAEGRQERQGGGERVQGSDRC